NTRLQVEHPVTELTTGLDLVEWQMRVAAGEPLPWQQHELRQQGWAIEARVNAEDPAARFAPALGPVLDYAEPALNGVRIDSGIDARSEVTPHYDSLVAKVIGHGATRAAARRRLEQGLQQLRVGGLKTTQPLLLDVLRHPAFDDVLDTGFLPRHWPEGWQSETTLLHEARAVAASAWLHAQRPPGDDRPLSALQGWRITAPVDGPGRCHLAVHDGAQAHTLVLRVSAAGTDVTCDGAALRVEHGADGHWRCAGSERAFRAQVAADAVRLWCAGWSATLQVGTAVARAASAATAATQEHVLRADLPGVLAQLLVGAGEHVRAGAPLAVLEAMKLFHTLNAPCDGVVRALPVAPGATVAQGATLIEFEPLTLGDA
ncbi:MAG: 3-methylcrotonyl-CoA carboxylase, partial [Burkholderiaceae bacterium]|nr:3-methylcrotonyl-CoA carboxylase [Burkholderiaceae bacterium]